MKTQTLQKALIAVLFVLLTVFGLCLSDDYGISFDEASEQAILRSNIAEYEDRLFGCRTLNDADQLPISQSIEKDHGQSVFYPIFWALYTLSGSSLMNVWHAYIFLWFMLGVIAVYRFSRLTGLTRTVSFLGALLMYISPRMFAEGHYNSKDMTLLSLFLLVLWAGAALIRKPDIWRALLFSLLGAMCTNMRIIGILPWGLMGLATVVCISVRREWNRRSVIAAVTAVLSFAVFYLLLTPAAWQDPVAYLRYLFVESRSFSRWTGVVLFRGTVFEYPTNPLPRYYFLYMIAVTLPLYTLPLTLCGGIHWLRQAVHSKADAFRDPNLYCMAAAALCTLLPLAYSVLVHMNVYNGWRHVYFTFSGIVLLGAQGISAIRCFLRRHGGDYGMHRVFAVGLCLFMAFTGYDMVRNHPSEYAYYNLLRHKDAETEMELDWWSMNTMRTLDALLETHPDDHRPLEISAQDEMSLLGMQYTQQALPDRYGDQLLITDNPDALYLYSNTTYANIYRTAPPEGYHETVRTESYDLLLGVVYEKDD